MPMCRAGKGLLLTLFCFLGGLAVFQPGLVFSGQAGQTAPDITVSKEAQSYTWILQAPGQPGVAQISLSLRDAGGPVQKRVVSGELWMPAMPMPGYPLELEFQEAEAGEYLALVQYGHGGHWRIRAKFKDDKGQLFQQDFDLDIID
jgi:hypothetical protein